MSNQTKRVPRLALLGLAAVTFVCGLMAMNHVRAKEWKSGIKWPKPKLIDAGSATQAPSDSVVLFDGTDMSAWEGAPWIVKDDEVISDKGDVRTKQGFGSCQLHLEWATPEEVEGSGQGRGNSGVYLMNQYEVQILDSYENETYFDGQAGAIYKQSPPMVNASRPPGEWQTYDIIFRAPQFDKEGKLTKPAYLTVLHNGVVIQNHFELQGATAWHKPPEYTAHPDKLPIKLQFHGDKVRFRNMWVREL